MESRKLVGFVDAAAGREPYSFEPARPDQDVG
jgi:hypothetical protein